MGWIKHDGKGRPVGPSTVVWVKCRDGDIDRWNECWKDDDMGEDITHYSTDEVCPDDAVGPVWKMENGARVEFVGDSKEVFTGINSSYKPPLPGMSEREFVQQHYLAVLASGNMWSMPDAIKYGRLAYRAIDEALSKEAGE
jgi:hypothetical protein